MRESAVAQLDAGTRARLEAACAPVNARLRRERRNVLFTGVAGVLFALVLWRLWGIWYLIIGLSFALAAAGSVAQTANSRLSRWFAREVARPAVAALGTDLTYSPLSTLTEWRVTSVDLLPVDPLQFTSEDEIRGVHQGVAFALHDVKAYLDFGRDQPLFEGIIAVLEFNKHFRGHTIVVPANEIGAAHRLAGTGKKRKVPRVTLSNPEFERCFASYATDDQQAHYVLTPKLMDLVLRARDSLGANLRLAFYENLLFVGVPSHYGLFDLHYTSSATAVQVFDDLVAALRLAGDLIDTLDLETRIWTRV